MKYNGIQLRQMTEHETKRTSWLLLHPRAEGQLRKAMAEVERLSKL